MFNLIKGVNLKGVKKLEEYLNINIYFNSFWIYKSEFTLFSLFINKYLSINSLIIY